MQAINSHNEMIVQAFVGGMWCAAFISDGLTSEQQTWLQSEQYPSPFRYGEPKVSSSTSEAAVTYNSAFAIDNYSVSSFFQQKQLTLNSRSLPFVADLMCSWYTPLPSDGVQLHECYLEFDNLTEHNPVAVQKMMNYIWYAQQHPDVSITLHIISNDNSIFIPTKSKEKCQVTPDAYQHLGNILHLAARSKYTSPDGTSEHYLLEYYEQVPNLKICLAGLSSSYMDIRDVMLGYSPDNSASLLKQWLNMLRGEYRPNQQEMALRLLGRAVLLL